IAHNVRPRRQHLAKFNIGGAKLFQRTAKTNTGIGLSGAEGQCRAAQHARGFQKTQETGYGAHPTGAMPNAWRRYRPTDCALSPGPARPRRSSARTSPEAESVG